MSFHKLLKIFKKGYCRYKDLAYEYNSTCSDLTKKDISLPSCYGDVFNNVKKFTFDTSKLVKSFTNIVHKGYDLTTMVHSKASLLC